MTAGTTHPVTDVTPTDARHGRATTWRILLVEVLDELRVVVREPITLLFSVAMPVGFFALFTAMWGDQPGLAGRPTSTSMLATFGTFGVVGVALLLPGIGIADDRERGWLRVKRVSPTPLPVTLAAKVIATVPYAGGVMAAMTAVAAATGGLELDAVTWVRLVAVLVVGAAPLALFALAVGLRLAPNPTTAVLNAVFVPSAVASGLWMPLEMLPDAVADLAPFLPTFHLRQLAVAQLGPVDGGAGVHVVALAATTAVGAALAAVAYRRARP